MNGVNGTDFSSLIILFCWFVSIDANWNVTKRTPNSTMFVETKQFEIEIDHLVDRPNFSAKIHFYSNRSNSLVYEIDVSVENNQSNYSDRTLQFRVNESHCWNLTDQVCITFDEGVLFFNETTKSTSRSDGEFWLLIVINPMESTSVETTETSIMTSFQKSVYSTIHQDLSTEGFTSTSMNRPTTTKRKGEPPPGYAARVGIGVGITFMLILICIEFVYFNYFYRFTLCQGQEFDA